MKALQSVVSAPFKALGLISKPPKPPAPLPAPTRDDAAAAAMADDRLRKRRGAAADMLLGPAGAEPSQTFAKALTGE